MTKAYTDQQIIDAFRTGDVARERAWEFAYKDWRDRIIGTIVAKNGTREEAKEAMQDVVMAFERRVIQADFVLQHKLSTYFISCVYRQWLRRKQAGKTSLVELEDRHLAGFVESVESAIAQNDLARLLDETLTQIGDRCKTILLHFMNGVSMKEIADKMGFSGGEQVAKNEKKKCQTKYEQFLRANPRILQHIQQLRNG